MKASDIGFLMTDLRRRYRPESVKESGTALGKISAETRDPFKVLISTILSQRTRDEMTEIASSDLFAEFPDARSLADAPIAKVRRRIRPVGFYNQKAHMIKEVSRILLRKHGVVVPSNYDDLVALPHVGPKTANCVLVYGFAIPRIPVDTHVHRISNRLGLVRTKAPEESEAALVKVVPREYWMDINGFLVSFGKQVCRPIGPRCTECKFTPFCDYYRRLKEKKAPSRLLQAGAPSRRRRPSPPLSRLRA